MRFRHIVQPIDLGDGKCHPLSRKSGGYVRMLRPGAFFWFRARLYVGYSWLSTLHADEKPVWDPEPVPLNALVDTCRGYFHFSAIHSEDAPYFRKYAEIKHFYAYKPNDYGYGFLKRPIDQGIVPVREQYILQPNTYLEVQWQGGSGGDEALLHRKFGDGENLERKIKRSPDLQGMRLPKEVRKLRKDFEKDPDCLHKLEPRE